MKDHSLPSTLDEHLCGGARDILIVIAIDMCSYHYYMQIAQLCTLARTKSSQGAFGSGAEYMFIDHPGLTRCELEFPSVIVIEYFKDAVS